MPPAAITQYFFNSDAYADFPQTAATSMAFPFPSYPGIMPITNHDRLLRFSQRCGAEIPRWIEQTPARLPPRPPPSLRSFGTDVVVQLCEKLIALGAPGFHFYILNQAQPTLAILERLGVKAMAMQVERN